MLLVPPLKRRFHKFTTVAAGNVNPIDPQPIAAGASCLYFSITRPVPFNRFLAAGLAQQTRASLVLRDAASLSRCAMTSRWSNPFCYVQRHTCWRGALEPCGASRTPGATRLLPASPTAAPMRLMVPNRWEAFSVLPLQLAFHRISCLAAGRPAGRSPACPRTRTVLEATAAAGETVQRSVKTSPLPAAIPRRRRFIGGPSICIAAIS